MPRVSVKPARRGAKAESPARLPAAPLLRSPFETPAGKVPQQVRSRDRVARILEVSTELIRDGGVARLTMTAVARDAQIPIGSLYQYFPTMSALVHRLFQDRLHGYHLIALARLREVITPQQCAAALRELMHELYVANREDPLMQEVWAGVQADRDIRHIHLQDNNFYSQLYAKVAEHVGVALPRMQLVVRARVINEMWDGVIRLAITRPKPEAQALIEDSLDIGLRALGIEP